jgi:hypothetical protein
MIIGISNGELILIGLEILTILVGVWIMHDLDKITRDGKM